MSDPIVTAEELPKNAAQPLPDDAEIESFQPAMPGWIAYYYVGSDNPEAVLGCPIAAWVLVTYTVKRSTKRGSVEEDVQEIRNFVITNNGSVVDYLSLPYSLLCVLGPGMPDHPTLCRRFLSELGLVKEPPPPPSGN